MTAVLRARGLGRRLGGASIVDDVSLELAGGEWMSLVGPSGCGKTTLLMMLGLLDRPDGGELWLDDKPTAGWSRRARARARLASFGFVFQTGSLMGHLTTRDNVALPAWHVNGSKREARKSADALLERFGLASRANLLAHHLSPGEGQRAAVARALVNRPRVVLADEPTGSLDSANSVLVLDALAEATARGAALLVATHDATVAARGRSISMRDGKIALPSGS